MRRAMIGSALVLLGCLSGCSPLSVAKRGFSELRGARGEALTVQPVSRTTLAAYQSVKAGNVTNEIGSICPSDWASALRSALPRVLADELSQDYPGGEPSLTVDVSIQYAQTGGTLESIVAPEKYLVARVYLRGSDAGNVGELVVVSRSEAARTGSTEMAEAAAQGIADYLARSGRTRDD